MSYELLKLVVTPVVLERDETGQVINERHAEAIPVFNLAQLQALWETVQRELARANADGNGGQRAGHQGKMAAAPGDLGPTREERHSERADPGAGERASGRARD